VAPGNHDFAGRGGYYDPSVLAALGMRVWPENVVVFREPSWAAAPVPGRSDAAVVGCAFLSAAAVTERPLSARPARPPVPHALLLLHGSLETYPGADAPRGAKATAPFSRRELLDAGFSWIALGHHHHAHVVADDAGAPRAAYSGCPTGRGLDETGPRVFLKVTIRDGEPAVVETVPADPRTIHDVEIDVSDLDPAALLAKADAALTREGIAEPDVLRVTLRGTQPFGAQPAAAIEPLSARMRHLIIRDRTSPPGPEAERSGLSTAEGRFLSELRTRLDTAPDAAARRVAELALRLGRDALAGRPVRPPDAERP
jgi:DNA repair exonuclease SbcCD nuclease subunit